MSSDNTDALPSFRGTISPDQATSGRYHLYVSDACPSSTRALIVLKLKGLDAHIGVTVVSDADQDPRIKELYLKAEPGYSGRLILPLLWDTQKQTIVSNDASEIVRVFNSTFNGLLAPEHANIVLPSELLADANGGVFRPDIATVHGAHFPFTFESTAYASVTTDGTNDGRLWIATTRNGEDDSWKMVMSADADTSLVPGRYLWPSSASTPVRDEHPPPVAVPAYRMMPCTIANRLEIVYHIPLSVPRVYKRTRRTLTRSQYCGVSCSFSGLSPCLPRPVHRSRALPRLLCEYFAGM